jgi:hypothetical protein
MKTLNLRHFLVSGAVLLVMILFSACAGVGSSNGQQTLSGSIVSASGGTLVISVNGQQDTIKNVPANIIQSLQGQVGKVYSITVTTNSDGSFSIVSGSNVLLDNSEGTPEPNQTPETNNQTPTTVEQGNIQFFGTVKARGNNNVTVSMPDGSQLVMSLNGTDLGDFNNALPNIGTQVQVQATTNADGSFNAEKISQVDTTDATGQATFQGVTTAAVGSDNVIHFTVGNKAYNFTINPGADLSDFNNSAQSIQSGTSVKVDVQYNGSSVQVLKVSNSNG